MGHFVSSPREREKRERRDSRRDEREEWRIKRNRNESEETEEIKTFHCKSYSHFFSKKFQHICILLNVNFNKSLTKDIVSFEQLSPGINGLMCTSNCTMAHFQTR